MKKEFIIQVTIDLYNGLLKILETNDKKLINKYIKEHYLINGICFLWDNRFNIHYLETATILEIKYGDYIANRLTISGQLIPNTMIKEATEKRIEHLKNLL